MISVILNISYDIVDVHVLMFLLNLVFISFNAKKSDYNVMTELIPLAFGSDSCFQTYYNLISNQQPENIKKLNNLKGSHLKIL